MAAGAIEGVGAALLAVLRGGDAVATEAKSMFLDPVDVITSLAIIAIYRKRGETGIKLSFKDNRVIRDHSRVPGAQAIKRAVTGGSHDQLSDMTTAIFYAAQWFSAVDDDNVQLLFPLAKDGIEALIETYQSGKDTTLVTQALTSGPKKILSITVDKGDPLNRDDFGVPDWTEHPLAKKSKEIWKADDYGHLREIASRLSSLVKQCDGTLCLNPDKSARVKKTIRETSTELDKHLSPLFDHIRELKSSV